MNILEHIPSYQLVMRQLYLYGEQTAEQLHERLKLPDEPQIEHYRLNPQQIDPIKVEMPVSQIKRLFLYLMVKGYARPDSHLILGWVWNRPFQLTQKGKAYIDDLREYYKRIYGW